MNDQRNRITEFLALFGASLVLSSSGTMAADPAPCRPSSGYCLVVCPVSQYPQTPSDAKESEVYTWQPAVS